MIVSGLEWACSYHHDHEYMGVHSLKSETRVEWTKCILWICKSNPKWFIFPFFLPLPNNFPYQIIIIQFTLSTMLLTFCIISILLVKAIVFNNSSIAYPYHRLYFYFIPSPPKLLGSFTPLSFTYFYFPCMCVISLFVSCGKFVKRNKKELSNRKR